MIHSFLQRQLNALLARDPQYLKHLAPLSGHSIVFKITDLRLTLGYRFHHSFIEVLKNVEAPELVLQGRSFDFGSFLFMKSDRQSVLQQKKIEFSGELLLLEQVETFFKAVGLQLPSGVMERVKQTLNNAIEILQEERQILVSPTLYQHFVDELFSLSSELDRLECGLAHINDRSLLQ